MANPIMGWGGSVQFTGYTGFDTDSAVPVVNVEDWEAEWEFDVEQYVKYARATPVHSMNSARGAYVLRGSAHGVLDHGYNITIAEFAAGTSSGAFQLRGVKGTGLVATDQQINFSGHILDIDWDTPADKIPRMAFSFVSNGEVTTVNKA